MTDKARPTSRFKTDAGIEILVKDLKESGYVIVRSAVSVPKNKSSMLIVNGQAVTNTHAHVDQLGFVLFEKGREIFVDSGKYGYNKDKWRKYYIGPSAHNIVTLEGVNFLPKDRKITGTAITDTSISSNNSFQIYGSVSRKDFFVHQRQFLYFPGKSLTLNDNITARKNDIVVMYFQLAPKLKAVNKNNRVLVYDTEEQICYISISVEDYKVTITEGQTKPSILGWRSGDYLKKIPATTIKFKFKAEVRSFSSTITIV